MEISVATWNLYLGADIVPAVHALSTDGAVPAAIRLCRDLDESRFLERASAAAHAIAVATPDLLGLQEMVSWVDITATRVAEKIDHLSVLLGRLHDVDEPYEVVVAAETYQVDLPLGGGRRLGMRNFDVLLARRASLEAGRLVVEGTGSGTYASSYHRDDHSLDRSGWVWADVSVEGTPARIHVTHLDAGSATIREAQAGELAEAARRSPRPPIVVGDLNTAPDGRTISLLRCAGLVDSWDLAGRGDGSTWSHGDDCRSEEQPLHRLDYVLCPDAWQVAAARLLGDDPRGRTANQPPLWPSDHNGVLAVLVPQMSDRSGRSPRSPPADTPATPSPAEVPESENRCRTTTPPPD